MEVGLFVLGVLVGVGLTWYLLERYQRDEAAAREANFNARVAIRARRARPVRFRPGRDEGAADRAADGASDRRGAHQVAGGRAAQAKRAAEQAVEQEMRQRQIATQLQDELAGVQARSLRPPGSAGADRLDPHTAALAAPAPAPEAKAADDLTEIKGIGKVIERRLRELGVTSFRQLAELSPEEAKRINEAIDFPGRIEREHWIEQARALLRS